MAVDRSQFCFLEVSECDSAFRGIENCVNISSSCNRLTTIITHEQRIRNQSKAQMRILIIYILLLTVSTITCAAPRLSPAWTDNAVIQRDAPIVIEGSAEPSETIIGQIIGQAGVEQIQVIANKSGSFTLTFVPRTASNTPLELIVSNAASTATQRVKNILIGDVWLCSGQSNMQLQVERGLDSWNQLQSSADNDLRLLSIPQATALIPQSEFGGAVAWTTATPKTVASFSAACYYMAKELRRSLKVPVGVIHSSWGGSQIRAWLSPEAGNAIYGAAEMQLKSLYASDPTKAIPVFAARWQDWYKQKSNGNEPWRDSSKLTWLDVPQIGRWNDWANTPLANNPVATVWLRHAIVLSAAQAKAGAELQLGVFDELDTTWVNGHAVGITHSWDNERNYTVPASYLKAGRNEILVALTNSWGSGGFSSSADKLAMMIGGNRISLANGWLYSISPVTESPPRTPWDNNAGIGVMHNKMIAPLGHLQLKGVAWYQGESDAGIPGYQDRLRNLIEGWRTQFGTNTRALIVQLANYGASHVAPTESDWATLRNDQLKATQVDKNAALITAIDLGERTDIHPANKIELGKRLALAAMGEALPQPVSAIREGDHIRVRFSGVSVSLKTWGGSYALGVELCGATPESCRYANAKTEGDSLLIAADSQLATRVRYAWADSPIVNVFDARNLPLPGFEIAVTQ
jgi:sialate O-acetylesterase